jgi:hypothetical protein
MDEVVKNTKHQTPNTKHQTPNSFFKSYLKIKISLVQYRMQKILSFLKDC